MTPVKRTVCASRGIFHKFNFFWFFETLFSNFNFCWGKVSNTARSPGGPAAACKFFFKSNLERTRFETLKKGRLKVAF